MSVTLRPVVPPQDRLLIRDVEPHTPDADELAALVEASWGAPVISRGRAHDVRELSGLLAEQDCEVVGALTYEMRDGEMEVVTIEALRAHEGVGTGLLEAATALAQAAGCRRLWLMTTNDNLDALRFYQRRGMRLVAVHPGAVDAARRRKPSIPEVGAHGIPLHDELELEIGLTGPWRT